MPWIALIIVLGALVGCAEGPPFVTGKTRAEIPVETVTLYLQPPPSYEEVGLVWATKRQDMGLLVAELKRQAAKLGANGVLLHHSQFTGEFHWESIAAGAAVTFLTLGILQPKRPPLDGIAIYVPRYRYGYWP